MREESMTISFFLHLTGGPPSNPVISLHLCSLKRCPPQCSYTGGALQYISRVEWRGWGARRSPPCTITRGTLHHLAAAAASVALDAGGEGRAACELLISVKWLTSWLSPSTSDSCQKSSCDGGRVREVAAAPAAPAAICFPSWQTTLKVSCFMGKLIYGFSYFSETRIFSCPHCREGHENKLDLRTFSKVLKL